jgi:4-hydroxybenzoate polyprenyltransferase
MSQIRAYAQLLRLPNVFTALADICLGWLAAGSALSTQRAPLSTLALLLGASACLYSAGMVWNDFFDVEQDRRERPFRPIPSGRVSRRTAALLGTMLLLVGVSLAAACYPEGNWQPLRIAGPLAGCILLYDAWLKRTPAGPIGMGLCRFLNVLLGMSATGTWPEPWMLHLAGAVGLYIVGVTWFARTEAVESRRSMLGAAAGLMSAAFILALLVPTWWSPTNRIEVILYPYSLVLWGFVVGVPVRKAIQQPRPERVQAAIKRCILGLIGLDALLAFVTVGWPGLLILLLLVPALWLGRWVYST